MRILFLDIDGPLVPLRLHLQKGFGLYGYRYRDDGTICWDPVACAELNKLPADIQIVFSTSHNTGGPERMRKTALANGFPESRLHSDICTKYPEEIENRIPAILDWINRNGDCYWVVVDDFDLPTDNLVNVKLYDGLTKEKLKEVFNKFGCDYE